MRDRRGQAGRLAASFRLSQEWTVGSGKNPVAHQKRQGQNVAEGSSAQATCTQAPPEAAPNVKWGPRLSPRCLRAALQDNGQGQSYRCHRGEMPQRKPGLRATFLPME